VYFMVLEHICHNSGLTALRHNILTAKKCNGKTGRGDFVMKDAHLGGHWSIVVNTVLTHEFGDPNLLRENAERVKVERCRDGYANRHGTTHACHVRYPPRAGFMGSSCASSTSLPTAAPRGTLLA
jgi:hypothetical protein